MNQLEMKLKAALENKENNLDLYKWKGPKEYVNGERIQKVIKLMDASEEQLKTFYAHCQSMLYNTDPSNPGRMVLLNIIKDQRERCNTELFLRFLENAYLQSDRQKLGRFSYWNSIHNYMDNNREKFPKDQLDRILVTSVTGGVPDEFGSLSIEYVRDGCLDTLGYLNRKHITLSFITKLGLWLTPQEKKEFVEESKSTGKSVIELVKDRCGLKDIVNVRVNPKGLLSFKEFRAMITLKSKKYSEMTTDQLVTLRNKVLFALEDEVSFHAKSWEERAKQIEQVADARGIKLDDE